MSVDVEDGAKMRENPLEERRAAFQILKEKHPNKYPVILIFDRSKKNELSAKLKQKNIFKHKYLVQKDTQFKTLFFAIRKNFELKPADSILVFTQTNVLMTGETMLSTVYNTINPVLSKTDDFGPGEDGFIYLVLTTENTFGGVATNLAV